MPQGKVSFEPIGFAEIPGWGDDDHLAAFRAFLKSCDRVLAASRAGNLAGKIATPPALLAACEEGLKAANLATRAQARKFFEATFAPHRVAHAGGKGLLTGYYEPILEGSRTRIDGFRTPIYKRPPELVNVVNEAQRGAMGLSLTHGKRTAAGIVPFATREEIDRGALVGRGLELLYLADPVDVFFMQIQGSGRIRLRDGSFVRVHYDGKNGYPYASIGRYLIDKGLLAADRVSMQALGRWLRADRDRGLKVMWHNTSYVFFRELAGEEAKSVLGVLEIPLTALRSLAVDTTHHPIGIPVYVVASQLKNAKTPQGFHRLMIAQDVGSAIRGPERGDIFFGSGPQAESIAGVTKQEGNLITLLPRPPASVMPAARTAEPKGK